MTKAAEIVEDARNGKDGGAILEMLEQLEQQIIELGAIKQAARDYVIIVDAYTTGFTAREAETWTNEFLSAHNSLKELVY